MYIAFSSCDLLEKSYLCGINNNKQGKATVTMVL